jgi:EmrB/QacA subfamily drug resistance transporter
MQAPATNKWLALAGLGLGIFMATLDSSIVNIAMPTFVEAFHTDLAAVEWVVLSYSLVLCSMMLGVARLGDMLDKKKIYLAGVILFTLGSGLCSLSPSIGWLIAFRALQGLGAVMMQALGIALTTEIFPASERGRALGINGGVVSVGIAIGPALGGLLIGLSGWQSIFWVNIPIGLLTFLMVLRFVPSRQSARKGQTFDVAGALILLVTLSCYALGMTGGQNQGFGSWNVLALLGASAAGLAGFITLEKRTAQPMVDLGMFRNTLFSTNLLMGLLVFIALAGGFVLPFYLEIVKGFDTRTMGLYMMAFPISMGVMAPAAGALSDRYGSRKISLAGLLVMIAGCLSVATLTAETSPLGIVLRLIPFGAGLGMFQSPNNSAIMGAAPRERLGVAAGLMSLSRTLGSVTGLPLIGSLFSARVIAAGGLAVTSAPAAALVSGISSVYSLSAAFIFAVLCLSIYALWLDGKKKTA